MRRFAYPIVLGLSFFASNCTRDVAGDPPSAGAPQAALEAPAAAASCAAAKPAAAASVPDPLYRVPIDGLPTAGGGRALVTIVVFSDYQCPYCRRLERTLGDLRTTYGDDLRLAFAERPLPMHDRARPAALAALAANAQGKLEPFRRRLFAAAALDDAEIDTIAREAGLDLARFNADRRATATEALTQSEHLADTLGVRGTPTSFVNGRKITGAQPLETFRAVVEERLAAARALVKSGVRQRDVYDTTIAGGLERVDPAADRN